MEMITKIVACIPEFRPLNKFNDWQRGMILETLKKRGHITNNEENI
jgi:hypothetical protein